MALDRQSIEKKDFPVGRRGYDPDAVDAHLTTLADEVSELKRSARRRSDTLASSASDQVRAIVEAAETSARDIQREAESDAREIRDEANSEAQTTREQATEQAREYVGRVSETTDTMLGRLGTMQSELDGLVDSLRGGAGRLASDLKSLQTELDDVRGVVSPRPVFEPEAPPASEPATAATADAFAPAEPQLAPASPEAVELEDGVSTPVAASEAPDDVAGPGALAPGEPGDTELRDGEPVPAGDGGWGAADSAADATPGDGANGDAEGARLIALNMALNGTPREETARYLDENFALADSRGLLDEVYASIEG